LGSPLLLAKDEEGNSRKTMSRYSELFITYPRINPGITSMGVNFDFPAVLGTEKEKRLWMVV